MKTLSEEEEEDLSGDPEPVISAKEARQSIQPGPDLQGKHAKHVLGGPALRGPCKLAYDENLSENLGVGGPFKTSVLGGPWTP